ncbi:MAG: hypothetical protein H6R19_2375 [Proteobacteria bacterium]|nr:hypothetical protein [Pseudomonadota bacterium]
MKHAVIRNALIVAFSLRLVWQTEKPDSPALSGTRT